MTRSSLLAGTLIAGCLLLADPALAQQQPVPQAVKSTIEGAWQVDVTVRLPASDCTTAAPVPFGPNPFPAFYTFHEGGTMSEFGSRSPPSQRSSGHGVWARTGHNQFSYRLMFHSFDPNGLLSHLMNIRADLNLAVDGQTFDGIGRFLWTDLLSQTSMNFCATMTGARITL